jgi:MFS family permease
LLAFGAVAVGAGLVRTVTSTYLPLLLAEVRDAPLLIGLAMLVNSAAGFAVPLLVGRWSDRRHTPRHGRRLFIAGGTAMTTSGLLAVALGHGSSFAILTAAGAVAYFGVNVVTTAHRALIHDCFQHASYARGTGTQEVAALAGGLIGLAFGGLVTNLALWAPFLLAAVGMPLLAWPTLRLPVTEPREAQRKPARTFRFYQRAVTQRGVRSLLVAEILWVIGYAPLPVFFLLYARSVLGLQPATASIWLAAFAIAAGLVMWGASFLRSPRAHKPLLSLGVACMGCGFLAASLTTDLVGVSLACAAAAVGFGLISTLGFSLFASLIPSGEAGGYTALYYSLRAVASALAVPLAGLAVALSDTYRSIFLLGGCATLSALIPLAFAMSPRAAAESSRLLD